METIIERCSPLVRSVARRYLANPVEVEDVTQEVWLSFTENVCQIETPASTPAWLVQVATHAAWRAQRRSGRQTPTADIGEWAAIDDTEEAGVRRAEYDRTRAAVRVALDELTPRDRRLVELLVSNDRPDYRRAALLSGRPIGSIGPTRQRIFTRLRQQPALAAFADADGAH
jgi:RNA polymerase sigma factor (sigma-70 family)